MPDVRCWIQQFRAAGFWGPSRTHAGCIMNYGEYRDKCVLVTGGLGFIGSNLVIRLVELGARVTVVDSLAPGCGGNRENLESFIGAVQIKLADIRDVESFAAEIQRPDVIFSTWQVR